jgi:hypothetical protein
MTRIGRIGADYVGCGGMETAGYGGAIPVL